MDSIDVAKSDKIFFVANLKLWFKANARPLPWREINSPYHIWISEVMLQQTTVKAVIPYYQRFLNRFPNLQHLAESSIEDVYSHWAGLGYYSRARNLHKAAQQIHESHFPLNHQELLALPGFGPYTARAVASFAFGESVGVVDGNIIRVLSRFFDLDLKWWNNKEKAHLQKLMDTLVQKQDSRLINQAVMELGATVCTPKSPACATCPLIEKCLAVKHKTVFSRPLKRPRRSPEIWTWTPQIMLEKNKIALVENDYAPFLKKSLLPPGQARQMTTAPKNFHFRHSITHHDIYVKIDRVRTIKNLAAHKSLKWVSLKKLPEINPASLLSKALAHLCLVIVMLSLVACAGAKKGGPSGKSLPQPPAPPTLKGAEALTALGFNSQASFSPDGQKIVYASRLRQAHALNQAYELNLRDRREKRLTFHDGSLSFPQYLNNEQIVYSSTTDEDKENPALLLKQVFNEEPLTANYPLLGTYQGSELYLLNRDSGPADRLTNRQGPDFFNYIVDDSRIYFLSANKKNTLVKSIDFPSKRQRTLFTSNRRIAFAKPNLKAKAIGWLTYSEDGNESELVISDLLFRQKDSIKKEGSIIRDWTWISDEEKIILSAKLKDKADFDIYQLDLGNKCLRLLFSYPGNEIEASISSDKQLLVFTHQTPSTSHIYVRPYAEPEGPCL